MHSNTTLASASRAPPFGRLPTLRREALRDGLPGAVDLLHRRQARLVNEGFIEDYVALGWLEWHGGALRLTVTGKDLCDELSEGWAAAARSR